MQNKNKLALPSLIFLFFFKMTLKLLKTTSCVFINTRNIQSCGRREKFGNQPGDVLTHACSCPSSHTSVCPQVPGGPFLPVSRSVLGLTGPGAEHILSARPARAAVEPGDQMHGDSCAGACTWMCRFNHLTRDWDL